jgi:hypothetical protein
MPSTSDLTVQLPPLACTLHGGKFGFENHMLKHVAARCRIDIFDPDMLDAWDIPAAANVFSHKIGVTSTANSTTVAGAAARMHAGHSSYLSYGRIRSLLKQERRTVNIAKLDIEGAEFSVLPEILASRALPLQLLVEVHLPAAPETRTRAADGLLVALRAAGYVMCHTEVNYNDAHRANEYTFLRLASRGARGAPPL